MKTITKDECQAIIERLAEFNFDGEYLDIVYLGLWYHWPYGLTKTIRQNLEDSEDLRQFLTEILF